MMRHKEQRFQSKYKAIVAQDLWDRVQALLQAASAKRRGTPAGLQGIGAAPPKGKFTDETGDLLTPSHSQKNGKRLRYYVFNRLVSGGTDASGWRLPAPAFEAAVVQAIATHLADHSRRHDVLASLKASSSAAASEAIATLGARLVSNGASVAAALIKDGEIGCGHIRISLDREALAAASGLPASALNTGLFTIDQPFTCRRRGAEMKIIAGHRQPQADATLIRGLRHAYRWSEALKSGTLLRRLATEEGFSERYMARVIPLSGLSPTIQQAILQGRQPIDLTLERLLRCQLPLDWADQERMLGFGG